MDRVNEFPQITVITVTYNSSEYVTDAIESVLAQSYTNIQYIIGDDCSTDSTWDLIQQYKDPRIIAYRNANNLSEYPNRNKAIEMATGKYFLFIDGDDLIYPHAIEFIARMVNAFPEAAMAIMRPYHPKLIYPVELSPREVFLAEYFDKSLVDLAFTNTVFKTAVIKQLGGLPSNYISGDTYIRLKIAKHHTTVLINDNLTWWRETPGQATVKLGRTTAGLIQSYEYKMSMLHGECPLNEEECASAIKNLQLKVLNLSIRMIIKGKIQDAYRYIRETGLLRKIGILFTYRPLSKDPFAAYSSTKPYRLPWERNPYFNGGSQ